MIDSLVTEVSFLARSSEEEVSDQTTHRSPPKLPKTCLDVRRPESGLLVFSVPLIGIITSDTSTPLPASSALGISLWHEANFSVVSMQTNPHPTLG